MPWTPAMSGLWVERGGSGVGVSDQELRLLTVRVGKGDHEAFRRLHGLLAPATLAAVRVELPEVTHAMQVVRSTFCEVWWMCALAARHGAPRTDVPQWIFGVARRRGAERRRVLDLIGRRGRSDRSALWADAIADHDWRTGFELGLMLNGHDTVRLPARDGDARDGDARDVDARDRYARTGGPSPVDSVARA
jgi:hypothetical protein